ncbi:MAG: hypothetical protein COA33_013475 [Fluviicola sp.]|nr:hypothetical protein [Fluviicola sp.]
MSSYAKKYTSSKNEQSLFLTWESGYKNVKIYSGGRHLQTIVNPQIFKKGFNFVDEELKEIQLKFSTGNPIILRISVDGIKYKPEKNIGSAKEEKSVKRLSTLFWVIAGFSLLIDAVIIYSFSQIQVGIDVFTAGLFVRIGISLLITATYFVVAFSLRKNQAWAYFVGTAIFIFVTILWMYSLYYSSSGGVGLAISLIRILIIVQLIRYFNVARNTKKEGSDNNLLDAPGEDF